MAQEPKEEGMLWNRCWGPRVEKMGPVLAMVEEDETEITQSHDP